VRKDWTTEESAAFATMFGDGVSVPEIARRMGRTLGSCLGKGTRLGLFAAFPKNRKTTAADKKRVLGMLRAGSTDAHAARVSGLHKNTVTNLRRAAGIPPLSGSEFRRKGAEGRMYRPPSEIAAFQAELLAVVSEGPIPVRDIHVRMGRGSKLSLNKSLSRLRRKGLVICEGKKGRNARWFTIGWWLEHHTALLWQYAHKIARKSPHLDIEDIVSELRIECAKCVKTFRPKGWKFSTYALSVARRAVGTWAVMERGRGVHFAWQVATTAPLTMGVGSLDVDVEGRDERDAPPVSPTFWEEAVKGLPERLAHVVLSHYRDGKNNEEIGRGMGVSRERVRQLIEKGLAEIRYRRNMDEYAA
jgi:DNA-directed RNA polymerase specialized sigma24 family protein